MPDFTIVLISEPQSHGMPQDLAFAVLKDLLPRQPDGTTRDCVVLAANTAYEQSFAAASELAAQALARQVADALTNQPVDVALLPAEGRRKQLLVADMDSTIIGQECIDEIADLIGRKAQVAAITEQAMRGEIAFEPALERRVGLLAGVRLADIDRLLADRITLNPGARTLLATMRAHGAVTALVSGGFTVFTSAIADRAGFQHNFANRLELDGGRLTGRVVPPILGSIAKLRTMQSLIAANSLTLAASLAVGDGANDLPMLESAGLGVAYHAKPAVAARARVSLRHADLTGLLFLQGYRQDEFVIPA